MAIFYEDARSPIVAELIRQGFEVEESETLRILDIDETAHNTDGAIALGTGAACIAATAGTLALSGFTLSIALPFLGVGLCGMTYWNSKITARDRETEAQFIADHPEVLNKVQAKIRSGAERDSIAAAYQQVLRAYRWGDDVPLDRVLGDSQTSTQSQSGLRATNDQDANRYIPESSAVTELQPTAAAPSFTSPNLTQPKTRSELIARLKQDCPLLLKLVKSHPIRAVGVQRSGKTTLVKRLTLLRMALMENHRVVASSPHYEAANQYPDVFDVVGLRNGKRDYPAIERAWYQMAGDVEACNMANITYVWDEFGLQDKAIPITPENDPIKTVLTSCLRETMKFQIYPIFILHGETAAFLPGSKGLVTVILASTVRVETIGEAVEGDDGLEMIRPTGRFNVTWLDGSKGEGILPAWLSEDFLLEMIGPRSIPVVKTSTAPIETSSATSTETIAHLENAYQAPAVEVELKTIVDAKPEGLEEYPLVRILWEYLDGKEARNLKQISNAVKNSGKISDDDLRERLGAFDNYKEAVRQVIMFGVSKGFINQVSEDEFKEVRKH